MSNSQRQDNSEQEATGSYSYPYGMDQSGQQQPIAMGVVPGQIAYAPGAYPGAQMVASGAAPVPAPGQPTSSYPATPAMGGQHQLAYQQVPHFHNNQQVQQQQEQLQKFWATQLQEADQATDFRNHNLPLARIKKIMKADEDVKMISAEAPVVFAKACEMFILELTLRSWFHTEENRRRTLQKNDIAAAITRTDIFDFLVDIVPRDELKEEGLAIAGAALPAAGGPAESVPYYYLPQHGAPGMLMGQPVDQAAAAMYVAQQPHPVTYMAWQQPPAQAQHRQDQPNQQQGSAAAPDP